MMDKDRVAAEAAQLRCSTNVNTAEEIDRQLDLLVEELQRIAAVSTPRRKPNNGRANPEHHTLPQDYHPTRENGTLNGKPNNGNCPHQWSAEVFALSVVPCQAVVPDQEK